METTYKPAPPPRPVAKRECACGCLTKFQPNRKDKKYLNKQHADFAYNNGIRRSKNASRIKHEKVLAQNDRILEKHFVSDKKLGNNAMVFIEILQADGYDFNYHVGVGESNSNEYYTYRYGIRLNPNFPDKVTIFKR